MAVWVLAVAVLFSWLALLCTNTQINTTDVDVPGDPPELVLLVLTTESDSNENGPVA